MISSEKIVCATPTDNIVVAHYNLFPGGVCNDGRYCEDVLQALDLC